MFDPMSNIDHDESCTVCTSALKITAQGTVYQLQLEIKHVLESLPSVRSFHGFEVTENSGGERTSYRMNAYAEKGESDTTELTEHALAHEALLTKESKLLEQPQCWLCFLPVSHNNGAQSLWLIEYDKGAAEPKLKPVNLLVKVYQNCASHIGLQNTDPLTGLANRQALSERLERILKGSRRSDDSEKNTLPSICMLDIDFFKRVNDDYGHLYGDEVLLLFSSLMGKFFRENDFLYRYGGEEFVVLLDTPTLEESVIALERFRSAVDSYQFPQVGNITVSIGFVQMSVGELPSTTMDKADQALYYAKENGRNQVSCYHELIHNNLISSKTLCIDSELF